MADGGERLTDGFDDLVAVHDTVLRQGVESLVDRLAHTAGAMGRRFERDDLLASADFASVSAYGNLAVPVRPVTPADDLAGRLAERFPSGGPAMLFSPFPLPDLSPSGWRLGGHPPFMLRLPGGDRPPLPDGVEVVEVTDADTLTVWERTVVEAFPVPGIDEWSPGCVYDARILGGPMRCFLATLDGEPVATSSVHVGHGVGHVEFVSTRPEARRRGIGAAVTWAATLADPSVPAVLLASDDGRPVYERRMGYVPLTRWTTWWHPSPAGGPAGGPAA